MTTGVPGDLPAALFGLGIDVFSSAMEAEGAGPLPEFVVRTLVAPHRW